MPDHSERERRGQKRRFFASAVERERNSAVNG
jgi:hypothetical protein